MNNLSKIKSGILLLVGLCASNVANASSCEVGIWYPYVSNDGVPTISSFTDRGMTPTFIAGDINAATLNTYDVLFIGRQKMIDGPEIINDIDALKQWITDGGGLIGESNATIYDSDAWRGYQWSSMLSEVMGVSGGSDGWDNGIADPYVTVTDNSHPITQGVSPNFVIQGVHAQEMSATLDTGKNATAIEIANSIGSPIIASEYGDGRTVYFPTAVGFGGMDWSINHDYETLFLNAVEWACEDRVIQVDIDVKPGSDPNCFNINGNGVVPVAILGSNTFDVTQIDSATLAFAGLEVRVRGKKGPLCHIEESNDDNFLDLVCQFEDDPSMWFSDTLSEASLSGQLYDGSEFQGSDSICVTQDIP
ncbi:hypothetical protein ACBZ91_16300 [Vibrio natriegens]|uniref:hypothetical protein n=1 Tax=Vibrio natriegens TaxID=691 RepID=UPI0035564BE4